MQIRHIVDRHAVENPYHVEIIREKLTRTLPAVLPHVVDELRLAVPEHIPAVFGGTFCIFTHTGRLIKSGNAHRMDRGEHAGCYPADHSSCKQPRLYWPTALYEFTTSDASGAIDMLCFVGRNEEYLALSIRFSVDLVKDRDMLSWFPQFLKP